MDRVVTKRVRGELIREGKTYTVMLDLTIKQVQPDESETPINIIQREALTSVFGPVIEDGSYTLRYIFDGKQEEHRARVQGGTLISGMAA
jgi:hypothetical protein